jgi:predicted amidohydrolase YtcJ
MSMTMPTMFGAPADYIFLNASVYTVDEKQPVAQAVAVRDNRILYVGDNGGAIHHHAPQTQVINCGGRTLMPGFIDSHFHLLYGSLQIDLLDLDPAETIPEILEAIQAYATANPDREWIEGVQLRYAALAYQDQTLDRNLLDTVVPDRPLVLLAFDGHTMWANSEALRRAGLLHGRALPPGNEIVMAADGSATGELRELAAIRPVQALIPEPDNAHKQTLLQKGLALAAQCGITSVHNMDNKGNSLELYAALEELGELTLRVYVPFDIHPDTPVATIADAVSMRERYQGGLVRAGSVKVFMDGVLESYTALMLEEYATDAGNLGEALHSAERFNAIAAEADRLGLQIFVHCCGDGAVRRTLDGYAHAQRMNGRRDSRHRVEHIEVISEEDIPRFKQLGVIASMQPHHAPPSVHPGDIWPARAGVARWPLSFAWETLRQAGAHLAYGSDWPVVGMNPMLGLDAGMNRQRWSPADPDQRQTLANLIAGYTRDAAYA